uniref:Uncharacterized protein n=1 Tax=Oryza punctata TaxID=4537 RepID=A0A0E0M1M0_ORYPU
MTGTEALVLLFFLSSDATMTCRWRDLRRRRMERHWHKRRRKGRDRRAAASEDGGWEAQGVAGGERGVGLLPPEGSGAWDHFCRRGGRPAATAIVGGEWGTGPLPPRGVEHEAIAGGEGQSPDSIIIFDIGEKEKYGQLVTKSDLRTLPSFSGTTRPPHRAPPPAPRPALGTPPEPPPSPPPIHLVTTPTSLPRPPLPQPRRRHYRPPPGFRSPRRGPTPTLNRKT